MSGNRFTDFLNEHEKLQIFISLLPVIIICCFILIYDKGLINHMQSIINYNSIISVNMENGTLHLAKKTPDGTKLNVSGKNLKVIYLEKGEHICSAVCVDEAVTRLVFDDLTSYEVINFEIQKNPKYVKGHRIGYTINGREYSFAQEEKMYDIYLDQDGTFKIIIGLESFNVSSVYGITMIPQDDGRVKLLLDSSFLLDYDEDRLGYMLYSTNLPTDDIYVSTSNIINNSFAICRPMPDSYIIKYITATGLPVFFVTALVWGILMVILHKKNKLRFMGNKETIICSFGAAAALILQATESIIVFSTI